MATHLGTLKKVGDSFTGKITTLAFSTQIDLLPLAGGSDGSPDYRVLHKDREIGAAWAKRARKSDAEYLSLRIMDPAMGPCAVYVALVESKTAGTWNLLMNEAR